MLVSMTQLLHQARDGRYAIPQPDFVNLGMAAAYLDAAASRRSPIILGYGTEYLSASEGRDLRHLAQLVEVLSNRYGLPVVLHLDHGDSYESCARAIAAGFTSVMIDGSALSFAENVALTRRVVELAHLSGVSAEAELGRLKTGAGYDLKKDDRQVLTDPEAAARFVEATGVDALAVSIGTVHGEYQGEPNIDLELLGRLREAVSVPLVLHGASGTGSETLRKCAELGITKVNIFTDIVKAVDHVFREEISRTTRVNMEQLIRLTHDTMAATLAGYIEILGSTNKAWH